MTTYAYDPENNLTDIWDAKGNHTQLTYFPGKYLYKTTFPSGQYETYSWDDNNNLTYRVDRNGNTIQYAYDNQNRIYVKEDPGGVNYYYDAGGRLTEVDDNAGTDGTDPIRASRIIVTVPSVPVFPQGFSHCSVTIQNGNSYTQYDAEPSGSAWWSQLIFAPPGPGAPPGPDSFVKNVPVPCDCAQKAANDINSSNMVYSFPFQNSNTAAAMMAADCGVYPNSWPSGAWGSGHGPTGATPPVNSNPWSPFNPWPPMQ